MELVYLCDRTVQGNNALRKVVQPLWSESLKEKRCKLPLHPKKKRNPRIDPELMLIVDGVGLLVVIDGGASG